MTHRHQFSRWKLHKSGRHAHLPDNEYTVECAFPPFWVQRCSCGHEHWVRFRTKPGARLKLRDLQGVPLV